MIKRILIIVITTFLLLSYSCDNTVDHMLVPVVPNDSTSSISLTIADSTINLGDTLLINIKIKNSEYRNGLVDFNDGTILVFSSLDPILDTTVSHFFRSNGLYTIFAKFYNDKRSESKKINITVLSSVILTVYSDTIDVVDTLLLHIQIPNSTYYHGEVNFGDYSPIVEILSSVPINDTVLTHKYANTGNYTITAKLNNEEFTDKQNVEIYVFPHYFDLSLSLNSIWKFSYSYLEIFPILQLNTRQYGTHTSEIISFEVSNGDTIYRVRKIRDDIRTTYGGNQTTIQDTTIVEYIFSSHTATFCWQLYYGNKFIQIPNHINVQSYPQTIWNGFEYSVYDDHSGPIKYFFEQNGSHGFVNKEVLTLIEYIKP